jgi:hypothetical protein
MAATRQSIDEKYKKLAESLKNYSHKTKKGMIIG